MEKPTVYNVNLLTLMSLLSKMWKSGIDFINIELHSENRIILNPSKYAPQGEIEEENGEIIISAKDIK